MDVNNGDSEKPDYRSRLVGQEFATHRDDSLYPSTRPLEAMILVLSHAASVGHGEEKKHTFIPDVKQAYSYTLARRKLYIELPKEDTLGGPDTIGTLRLNLYGTRDGTSNWQEHLAAHTVRSSFTRGACRPSIFGTKLE